MVRPDIEAIKGRAEEAAMFGVMAFEADVLALLAYVAELEAVARGVATGEIGEMGYNATGYCRCGPSDDEDTGEWIHQPGCLYNIARQLLTNQASRTLADEAK